MERLCIQVDVDAQSEVAKSYSSKATCEPLGGFIGRPRPLRGTPCGIIWCLRQVLCSKKLVWPGGA